MMTGSGEMIQKLTFFNAQAVNNLVFMRLISCLDVSQC